jgi:hypothetical protein
MSVSFEKPSIGEELNKGKSKIEKGLREFRIYRVARNRNLLDLRPRPLEEKEHKGIKTWGSFGKLLNRALFFTTQKEMALEYRDGNKRILLEQRGLDFLSDLQKLEDQGIRIILLSHENLIPYQKLMFSDNHSMEDIEKFFNKHTFLPSQVSPRMLRRTAEIIILMPEDLNVLPLSSKTTKKQIIKGLSTKQEHQGEKSLWLRTPGRFHQKAVDINKKPDKELKQLHSAIKRLESRRSELFQSILRLNGKDSDQEKLYRSQIELIDKELTETKKRLFERHDKIN